MAATAIDLLAPVRRLTVAQYRQMSDAGVFGPEERVELIEGVVVEMSPQGWPHIKALAWLTKAVVPQLDPALIAMPQLPAPMSSLRSMPEPDIWVTREDELHGEDVLPLLVVEVAQSSLAFDRLTKARLYARRGVADYWIVDLREEVVEVLRAPTGDRWEQRTTHAAGAVLEPLLLPGVTVDVGALLAFAAS